MSIYFVADTHLCEDQPAVTTAFIGFLQQLPEHCQLYILGDLFDYWVGDDSLTPWHVTIAEELKKLTVRHIKIFFIHGNRDFLLGKRYAKRCGMKLLGDINNIRYHGKTILFLHGDQLCTDDHQYQKFRLKMKNRLLQWLFLHLPLRVRQRIALRLRRESDQRNRQKAEYVMDVNQNAVLTLMGEFHSTIMVHGHTHKPDHHTFLLKGEKAERLVLGAWHDELSYIKFDEQRYELVRAAL